MASLPSGAIAWWTFDNINGVLAPDLEDDHDGIIVGATPIALADGGGLAFDGVDDFVSVPASSAWDFGSGDFTIDLWANFAAAPGGDLGHPGDVFISDDEGAGDQNKWFVSAYDGFLDFHVNSPTLGPQFFAITPFNPTPGQWYNIALTKSGSQYTFYINGVAAGSATEAFAIPDVNAALTIGTSGEAFGGYFNGDLAQVAIFNRALAPAEVQEIYAAGPTGGALPVGPASFQLSTDQAGDTGPFTLSISSTAAVFEPGATVTLSEAEEPSVVSTSTTVDATAAGLTAVFDFNGQADGSYAVTITNPDGSTYTVGSPLQIQPVSAPALWAEIIGPTGIRAGTPASYAIEYGNTGNVDATTADILLVNEPGVDLSVHPGGVLQYSGIDVTPSGSDNVLVSQLPALDVPAGSVSVVPFFAEADASGGSVEFGAAIMPPVTLAGLQEIIAADGSTTIDWGSLEPSIQSPAIDSTDWSLIWDRFTSEVGTTTQSLFTALSSAAATLSEIGEPTTDLSSLLGYELEQASAILPNITLADTTDIADNGGGLDLSLTRTYSASLLSRNNPGPFGDGWTFTYGVTVATDASGNVYINSPSGIELFTVQSDGSYAAQADDTSTLALVAGAYVLTNISGTVEQFLSDGQLSSITDLNGNVVTVSYNDGVISGVTSSNGQSLSFTTNAQGRITSATDGEGQTVTYTYDPTGDLLLSATGPDGTTSYAYDNSGNPLIENALTQIVNPDDTTANFEYNGQGYLSSGSGTDGAGQIAFSYPSTGTITGTDAAGNVATLVYDPSGNVAETKDALGNTTQYQYNASGELTGVVTPTGATYAFSYGANGNLTGYTDPDGGGVSATYAPGTDLLTSFTDQDGNTTSYSYNAGEDLTGVTYDNGDGTSYQYSPSGLLTSSTNADGQTTAYAYNAQGLLTLESFTDGTFQAYGYNALGELTSAQATDGGVTTYGYNTAGELTSVTNPAGQVESYAYDSGGQELTRTEPDGSVTQYTYNVAGQLAELQDGSGNLITQYTYNALGQLTGSLDGNGQTTSYQYDADGNVTQILTQTAAGTVTSQLDYTYDADGHVATANSLDGAWTYTYDASGQLTNAVFASTNPSIANQNLTYEYDAAGNRTETIFNGAVNSYTTNGLDQYTASDGTTYDYDADGNLISMTQSSVTTAYTYNPQNQLTVENGPSGNYTYQYDALGNMVSSTDNGVVSNYIVDPLAISTSATGPLSAIAQAYDAAENVTATYDYGNGLAAMINSGGTYYYNADATDNVISVSGAGGELVNTYNYTPFGALLASTGSVDNSFQYSGGLGVITNADGLIDMRARFYDPTQGKFVSRDPIGIAGGSNLYSYANNDPTTFVDPSGLEKSAAALMYMHGYKPLSPEDQAHIDEFGHIATGVLLGGSELAMGEPLYSTVAEVLGGILAGIVYGSISPEPWIPPDFRPIIPPPLALPPPPPDDPIGPLPTIPLPSIPPLTFPVVSASDPNDISGPQGVGAAQFVNDATPIGYEVSFENLATASAAAQDVVITDQLDPTKVNFSTFSLGPITFGSEVLTPPAASSSYSTVVDLRPANDLLVEINAGLNTTTGLVTWTFTSLDPTTGQPTANPLAGFLPPDVTPPEGDGSVFFSVQPNSGLTTGTQITDSAAVTFDANPPIATSQWLNTIDSSPPVSTVTPLTPTEATAQFSVSWSGSDQGSGIASYSIYDSDNGGAWTPWLQNTTDLSDVFTGTTGHTYGFYSIATDNVGNVEAAPAAAETTTLVECFLAGTRIATGGAEVRVEDLAVGDLVQTGLAGLTSVKWIGHRRIDCRRHAYPHQVWPVRVAAGAFGEGLPRRDLWLSPDHAVFTNDVLIPVKYLVNGTTIVQEARDEVTYCHVELERHDVILAEELPCESYLDNGKRSAFTNGGCLVQMHPDFAPDAGYEAMWEATGCAPLRIEGEVVDRVAARLRRRATTLGHTRVLRTRRRSARCGVKATDLGRLLQPAWYLARNPDVAEAGVDAAAHYARWGRQEGRLPCHENELVRALGLVDPSTIVFTMPDVIVAEIDPVTHFCGIGWRERRRPNPYFDTGWYLDAHDVPADMNPLLHYVLHGENVGLSPSPHFDPAWYRQRYAIGPTTSPLAHYLKHRRTQDLSPLPTFDVAAYVRAHRATLLPNRDPYAHFLAIGRFATARHPVDCRAA